MEIIKAALGKKEDLLKDVINGRNHPVYKLLCSVSASSLNDNKLSQAAERILATDHTD